MYHIKWYRICEPSTICHMNSHHFCDQCALHVDGWESTWDFFDNRFHHPFNPLLLRVPQMNGKFTSWDDNRHNISVAPGFFYQAKKTCEFLDVHLFHFLCFLIPFQLPTLPETNRVYPKKSWWLENDAISFLGPAIFIGAMLAANFREGRWKLAKKISLSNQLHSILDWMLPIQSIAPPKNYPEKTTTALLFCAAQMKAPTNVAAGLSRRWHLNTQAAPHMVYVGEN